MSDRRSSVSEEGIPFLDDDDSSTLLKQPPQHAVLPARKSRWHVCSTWLIHLILLFGNVVFFAANVMNSSLRARDVVSEESKQLGSTLLKPNYAGMSPCVIRVE